MAHPAEVADSDYGDAWTVYAVPWDLGESSWHRERQGWVNGEFWAPIPDPEASMNYDRRV